MIHIKRIDEAMNPKTYGKRTEYVITTCMVITAEDNYEKGEINDDYNEYYVHTKSDTLEGLMRKFVDDECYGHEFNINDWVYDPENPSRLELAITGKLLTGDTIHFEEPSKSDLEKFRQGKTNLTAYVFQMNIEKHIIDDNLVSEFRRIGVHEM